MSFTFVKSAFLSATGTVANQLVPCRLRGLVISASAVAGGDVIIAQISANSTLSIQPQVSATLLQLYKPSAVDFETVWIPEPGIFSKSGLHVTLPAATQITVFYDGA